MKLFVCDYLLWEVSCFKDCSDASSCSQSSEVHYVVGSPGQEDEGYYTCVAASSAGTGSSIVYLDVKGE